MSTEYRTKRRKIVDALVDKIKLINGQHPYNSNVFNNVTGRLKFLDEIEEYPKVCIVAGDEIKRISNCWFQMEILNNKY